MTQTTELSSSFPMEAIAEALSELNRDAVAQGRQEELERRRRFYLAFLDDAGAEEKAGDGDDDDDDGASLAMVSETTATTVSAPASQSLGPSREPSLGDDQSLHARRLLDALEAEGDAPLAVGELAEWAENNDRPPAAPASARGLAKLCRCLAADAAGGGSDLTERQFDAVCEKLLSPGIVSLCRKEPRLLQDLSVPLKKLLLVPERLEAVALLLVKPLLAAALHRGGNDGEGDASASVPLDLAATAQSLLPPASEAAEELSRTFLLAFRAAAAPLPAEGLALLEATAAAGSQQAAVFGDRQCLSALAECLRKSAATLGSDARFAKALWTVARALPDGVEAPVAEALLAAASSCEGFMARAAEAEVKKRLVKKQQ